MGPDGKSLKVFINGDIISMDPSTPRARELAVEGDRILALGNGSDLSGLKARPDTELVDLKGKTVVPGLIEPHTHPITSSLLYQWADVSGFTHQSRREVMDALRDAVEKKEKGEWVTAFGYDPILIRELTALTADELDRLAPENPVFVMIQSMHTAFVNRAALKRAGVGEDSPQPAGGSFVKDESGRLTGMVVEQGGMLPFLFCILLESSLDGKSMLDQQLGRFAAAGYTTLGSMGEFPLFPDSVKTLKACVESGPFPMRVVYMDKALDLEAGQWEDARPDSDRFYQRGAKIWYDGSPYSGNMHLDDNFLNSELMQTGLGLPADSPGYAMMPYETLRELIGKYHDWGFQIAVHGQGDRAVREILDAFEYARNRSPRSDHRHRIEHGALFPPDQLARTLDLGLTVSWHINHIYYYGEALRDDIIGPERAARLMPFRSALDRGLRCSLHNDSPMYPPEPFKLIRTAVTRRTRRGSVIGPDQAVTVMDALKAVTIDAAWQLFLEDEIGSLTPGKKADLTILNENPLMVDPDRLDLIKVLETYSGGEKSYGRE